MSQVPFTWWQSSESRQYPQVFLQFCPYVPLWQADKKYGLKEICRFNYNVLIAQLSVRSISFKNCEQIVI